MTFIRKPVSALCLALCCSASLSSAQTVGVIPAPGNVATTTNLVNSTPTATTTTTTWQNIGLWNQGLPCWAPGGAVYCGPQPYFNQGTFNFSYGVTDVYQTVDIASALPSSGIGLRVTGYNFGFTAKNGNGWDGGGLDTLWAYVRFADKTGKILENDTYNLNYVFDWTQFNLGRNFTTPYSTRDVSTATYGFVGGDTSNYWAGPYGPEIYNISFSLRYDVDPCSYNPLSSPTCPGFADAMKRITDSSTAGVYSDPVPATSTTTVTPTATVTTAPTATAAPATATVTPTPATITVTPSVTATAPVARSVAPISLATLASIRNLDAQAQSQAQSVALQSSQQSQETSTAVQNSSLGISTVESAVVSPALGLGSGIAVSTQSNNSAAESRPGDPLQQARGAAATTSIPQASSEPTTNTTTRTLAPPSQLAGGADFASMSQATNLNSYAALRLTDAVFYQPREIYRGQRVVDNARVLRGLGTDRLHQQMVDQQYGR